MGRKGLAERGRKKPKWAIDKERARKDARPDEVWLFGLHAVRDALLNRDRTKHRLILTKNAADRLSEAVAISGVTPEIADARNFPAPLDPGSVHQGAALCAKPLDWGDVSTRCAPGEGPAPRVLLLDQVTDPHNVGAILRSAEVFGARAVIATRRHAAPETGALAKAASGALERQPYLRMPNLARAMGALAEMGYALIGLDGGGDAEIAEVASDCADQPTALVLGAEGPGLRQLTRETCHRLARVPAAADFGSLNVSNAAAVALYAFRSSRASHNER